MEGSSLREELDWDKMKLGTKRGAQISVTESPGVFTSGKTETNAPLRDCVVSEHVTQALTEVFLTNFNVFSRVTNTIFFYHQKFIFIIFYFFSMLFLSVWSTN